MNTTTYSSIRALMGRIVAAGLAGVALLAASSVRAQYVSTAISNNLSNPSAVTVDGNGNAYVADAANNRIVQLVVTGGATSVLAGQTTAGYNDATGIFAKFNNPSGVVYDAFRGGLVVVDQYNQLIRLVTLTNGTGKVSTLAGVYNTPGFVNGATNTAKFSYPFSVTMDSTGNLYFTDWGNNAIRILSTANSVSTLNVGSYKFNQPSAVAIDNNGNVWVADTGNEVITMVSNGVATVEAGTGEIGTNDSPIATTAQFNWPSGLLWDTTSNILIISDTRNDTVRSLFLTNFQGTIGYAVQTIAGLPGVNGYVDGALGVSEFFHPYGLCVDSNASGYFVTDSGNNALRALQPTQPPPPPVPVPNPVIGYVTFPLSGGGIPAAQFNPITQQISVFNNVPVLAIEQLDGTVQTFMSYGATGSLILPPGTNTPKANVFTSVDIGQQSTNLVPNLGLPIIPNLTLETISLATGRPSSAAISAEIEYVTANPVIVGVNPAAVVLNDDTSNAMMWYTLDGTTPVPGATNTFPASSTVGVSSGQIIAFNPVTNTTLSVQAFTSNSSEVFTPSGVVTAQFSSNSYVTDDITFGFATGEASSEFITAPGQTFIAPVTLTLIPTAEVMDSLQFTLAISNITAPPVPLTGANAFTFSSMLEEPVPGEPGVFETIPPEMFTSGGFSNLLITNGALIGVGWLERSGETNLYNTLSQTLITFSQAHDTLFMNTGGEVIVGGFSFHVPTTATVGQQYAIQIANPSATSDGISTAVTITAPTNGSTTNGLINSIKIVTVGTAQYLVGDVAPFRWFNAGDFGDSFLEDNDVTETFQTAIYGLNGPDNATASSDYFDAMDSSDGTDNNYYLGSDPAINNIKFGDGFLRVDDVYVTYRRSLDPSLTWYNRFDTATGKQAVATPNLLTQPFSGGAPASAVSVPPSGPRYVSVQADQVVSGGNLTVQVPVRVTAADTLPITVMMLHIEVDPLDGSPPITSQISFTANTNLGTEFDSISRVPNDFGAAWLNSALPGVGGTNILGTVTVTLPSTVTSNSAYLVHFDHFSSSPNGIALFHSTVQDGLITVGNRNNSSWGDGISDAWRLLWFGTVSNSLSAATADPDGDGANNWQEYIAGTNPNDATSVFQFVPGSSFSPGTFTCQWSSVANKHYTIQSSYTGMAGPWKTVVTNVLGNGQTMQWTDSNATGKAEFYRALVQ